MKADDLIDRLREVRAARGLSQRALADRMGYAFSTLDGWERQYRQPGIRALCDWCEALGVEIEIRG